MDDAKKYSIPALDRAIDIIELMASSPGPISFSNIHSALRIPRASLVRILHTLRDRGIIDKVEDSGYYRLGMKLLYLGHRLKEKIRLRSVAWPYMQRLSEMFQETVELSTLDKDQLILIEQIEGNRGMRLFSRIGGAYPYFHAVAPGKIYLAHMESEKRSKVLKKMGMPAITEYTITDLKKLDREVKTVLVNGYAVEKQELRIGVVRVAAPIYDHEHQLTGCLGVAVPIFNFEDRTIDQMGKEIKNISQLVSKELGDVKE
jgi:DNA-binding IclR family transcriptional regulator